MLEGDKKERKQTKASGRSGWMERV